MSIITSEFRGSYVNAIEPRADDNGKEWYSLLIPIKKDDPFAKEVIAKVKEFGDDYHNGKAWKKPFKDGDDPENLEKMPQFAGHIFFNAKTKFAPQVINRKGERLTTVEDVYSGAWYKASLSLYGWNQKSNGRGVSFNLNNLIKMKDDEKFGGGANAIDEFSAFIDEDSDTKALLDAANGDDDASVDDLLAG